MIRLVQARVKGVLYTIDKSVTEGNHGGINFTKQELANNQSIGKTTFVGLNEDLLELMDTLEYI